MAGGRTVARWPGLPALRRPERIHQGPRYYRAPWPLYVQRLPLTVHGDCWNAYGTQQNPAHQIALCNLFAYIIEEGNEHSTVASNVRCEPEIHMVFNASHP